MIRINLLKPEKKETQESFLSFHSDLKMKNKKPRVGFVFLFLVVSIGALFFYQQSMLSREKNLLRIAKEEKKKLQDVLSVFNQLEEQKSLFKKKIELITQLKSRQEAAVILMDELSKNIPEWVSLNEVSYSFESIQIKGEALSNNLIADYIFNLEESPHFSNVNLISSTQKSTQTDPFFHFSLTAKFSFPTSSLSQEENKAKGETG